MPYLTPRVREGGPYQHPSQIQAQPQSWAGREAWILVFGPPPEATPHRIPLASVEGHMGPGHYRSGFWRVRIGPQGRSLVVLETLPVPSPLAWTVVALTLLGAAALAGLLAVVFEPRPGPTLRLRPWLRSESGSSAARASGDGPWTR